MYHTNALTNQYLLERRVTRVGWKINLRAVNRFLLLAIIASFVVYMLGNNDFAVKSFILKDLKSQVSDLTLANKELEVKVTALSSYQYLSQKTGELKFVPVTEVKYLPVNNQIFAQSNL
jgi:hypothetical protein